MKSGFILAFLSAASVSAAVPFSQRNDICVVNFQQVDYLLENVLSKKNLDAILVADFSTIGEELVIEEVKTFLKLVGEKMEGSCSLPPINPQYKMALEKVCFALY
jgi:hypothetical protein